MPSQQLTNGAPQVIPYGTQDLSKVKSPREPEAVPQHLPKFYIFAQKGPLDPQLVVGAERINMYGDETFNELGKYANHATIFSNLVNTEGNACMLQRVISDDAGPEATIIAWLDVLPTTVDDYQRNSDGSIKLDSIGNPTIIGTTPGFKVKWVITNHASVSDLQNNYGNLTITAGDQVDPVTNAQSQRYPIFELKHSFLGEYGNNTGIRLWAPTSNNTLVLPTKLMADSLVYPYFISVIHKQTANASPQVVNTLFGEQDVMVTFKPDVIDGLTGDPIDIGTAFISSYQNLTDLRYPKLYGEFGNIKVYQDNINTLLAQFHAAEVSFIDQFSDFTSSTDDIHLFNFITGVTSQNVPYHSFVFVDSSDSVRFTQYTNVYAAGGSDGTMDHATHADLVKTQVNRYLDENDQVQELAVNVESVMYDSGFPLDTKFALCSFIGVRKDTRVVLGTHDVEGPLLTESEEHSIAVALRTRLQMFPESDYFGTPVMRGVIVGRSGLVRDIKYKKRLPCTAEIAIKSARYMGASNGRWKNGENFDGAPGSIVDTMTDINITWVPVGVRNRNWDVGLNWIQAYDRRSFFFPALKTVYDDDTSVLNSLFTTAAICEINKIANAAWREFSGVSGLTNAQLITAVNAFINKRTLNRFDGRYVIIPDTVITDADLLRGFSWTTPIKIYSPNMKTVMTTYTQAYRIEDLQQ